MTRDELAELVESWRRTLLPEWRVELSDTLIDDGDGDDYYAMCHTSDDYAKATIYFTDECLGRSRNEVEVTVVHELLHALTRPWRKQIRDLSGAVAYEVHRALDRTREHEEEQLVDRLARVLTGGEALPGTRRVSKTGDT